MSIHSVKEDLKKYHREEDILEFDVSSATVELAAKALNVEPGMIAKTLAFTIDDKIMLIVMAGDRKVDNAKFKQTFQKKAHMAHPDQVLQFTSHQVGGVCPFGLNEQLDVYLDLSLKKYDFVYPACGSSNSAIQLNLDDLYQFSHAIKWVDISK